MFSPGLEIAFGSLVLKHAPGKSALRGCRRGQAAIHRQPVEIIAGCECLARCGQLV